MKTLMAAGAVALALLAGTPGTSQAQSDVIGNGLLGAGVGAAIGGIAGGGRGAATGAIVGGAVGATSAAVAGGPRYAAPPPPYRGYVSGRGCGPGGHWVSGHHNRYGEWRGGRCAPNY